MLFFTRRRANQLTMARKFTGREAAQHGISAQQLCSSSLWDGLTIRKTKRASAVTNAL
jgi:hypothetical protein